MSQNDLLPTDSAQTHYHNANTTILCNLLWIYLLSPMKLAKVVMILNRLIVVDYHYMYSAARVDQFEMKVTCIEFVINVSRQGNNVKIKLNLNINLQRLQS